MSLQNIFIVQIQPSWWVKIGDFGIAKPVRDCDATELRTATGTQGYEAPEIRGYVEVDEHDPSSVYTNVVDIWSLGCVIYKAVAKHVPFQNGRDIKRFCDKRILFPTQPLQGKLTADGIEFLRSILVAEPNARPTVDIALQHPWLVLDEEQVESAPHTAIEILNSEKFSAALEAHMNTQIKPDHYSEGQKYPGFGGDDMQQLSRKLANQRTGGIDIELKRYFIEDDRCDYGETGSYHSLRSASHVNLSSEGPEASLTTRSNGDADESFDEGGVVSAGKTWAAARGTPSVVIVSDSASTSEGGDLADESRRLQESGWTKLGEEPDSDYGKDEISINSTSFRTYLAEREVGRDRSSQHAKCPSPERKGSQESVIYRPSVIRPERRLEGFLEPVPYRAAGVEKVSSASAAAGLASPTQAQKEEAKSLKSQGNSAMDAKNFPAAIYFYTAALALFPRNPIFLSNRAAAYTASEDYESALLDAEAAIEAAPKYTRAWIRLGTARFALGDPEGSMEAYQKGIEYEGSDGSDTLKKSMKAGYEIAKKRVAELEKARISSQKADFIM